MPPATETLRDFVRNRAGINLGADKDYLIHSRLQPQLRTWGVTDLDRLAEAVRLQPMGELASNVVSALTTNETLWFRDTRPFEVLRTRVLPDAVKRGSLSIWSAACSTGQEPYSIAITLQEEAARLGGCRPSILASDISEPALVRARAGLYSAFEAQRGLTPTHLSKHFIKAGDAWQVRPELKTSITFRHLNLLELPSNLGLFDIVFCRNVLIYFDAGVKSRVLTALAARMRPGAWLFVGGAETTFGLNRNFVAVPGATAVFQRH